MVMSFIITCAIHIFLLLLVTKRLSRQYVEIYEREERPMSLPRDMATLYFSLNYLGFLKFRKDGLDSLTKWSCYFAFVTNWAIFFAFIPFVFYTGLGGEK